MDRGSLLSVTLMALAAALLPTLRASARTDTMPAQRIFNRLLAALIADDHAAFVADGDAAFTAALTKPILAEVNAQLAPRLTKGYMQTYFGELHKQGCRVHLWKLAFVDGGDDVLVTMSLRHAKVAGFFVN